MSNVRTLFEQARARAAELAAKSERTPDEEAELSEALDRAEALKAQHDAENANASRLAALKLDAVAEVSRAIAAPPAEAPTLTVGEYLVAAHQALTGEISTDEFRDRAARYLDRAASDTSDVAGVVPESIIGPVIDASTSRRKVFDSFAHPAMPAKGKTFERPYIKTHVGMGTQSSEGAGLTSSKLEVDSTTVTKSTVGGSLVLPRQVIDWTEPSALDILVGDFAKRYNRWVEGLAVTALEALPGVNTSPYSDADIDALVASYTDAVVAAWTAMDSDDEPLTIWLSIDSALKLAEPVGSTDRTGRSVVDEALEAIDADVNWVTSMRMTADTRIIGPAAYIEGFEQLHGLLSLTTPSTLSTDLSYSGYVAFHGHAAYFTEITGT